MVVLDGNTTREALKKWADEDIKKNQAVQVGDSGFYVKTTSKWEDNKGDEINNVKSFSDLPDGSYYYRYERDLGYKVGDNEIKTSGGHVTIFTTVEDGEIHADNATGGQQNINPTIEISDGVSSSFTQGERAVVNQPFEVEASIVGYLDLHFLSRSLNLYAYIDNKTGINAGGCMEFEDLI